MQNSVERYDHMPESQQNQTDSLNGRLSEFDDDEKRKFAKPNKTEDQWNISADDLVKYFSTLTLNFTHTFPPLLYNE